MRDHGPGVPPEIRDRLFEPYVTTKTGGTGLGLALVRQTIEDHGGQIRYEEPPGGGARFVVELGRMGSGADGQMGSVRKGEDDS